MPDSQVTPAVSQLLSKSQVAERYQCSTRTVDRLQERLEATSQHP